MIKAVTVTNHLGESLTMDLMQPEGSGFTVRSISGLGPVKATVNVTEGGSMDGSSYNSSRAGGRNIVIKLGFTMDPTIEHSRQKSYRYFPIKKRVTLTIETDTRTLETFGWVESNQPDIFSPDSTGDISIVCTDAYFYSPGEEGLSTTAFFSIEPRFEFPFGNESLTTKLLEMSSVENGIERQIFYDGDAEVGLNIVMRATGPATNVTIHNVGTRESMTINTAKLAVITGSAIIAQDEIVISTVRGAKSIWLLRAGVYTNILNTLETNVDWFTLTKGVNVFAYEADTGVSNLQFTITNRVLYEGV